MIQEVGRSPGPGRPILYNITQDFLGYFGIMALDELPPLGRELSNGVDKTGEELSGPLLEMDEQLK